MLISSARVLVPPESQRKSLASLLSTLSAFRCVTLSVKLLSSIVKGAPVVPAEPAIQSIENASVKTGLPDKLPIFIMLLLLTSIFPPTLQAPVDPIIPVSLLLSITVRLESSNRNCIELESPPFAHKLPFLISKKLSEFACIFRFIYSLKFPDLQRCTVLPKS